MGLTPNSVEIESALSAMKSAPELLRKLGYSDMVHLVSSMIGRGNHAVAFRTPIGLVLKLTLDADDAAVAQLAMKERPEGIVRIHEVLQVPQGARYGPPFAKAVNQDLFAILSEEVEVGDPSRWQGALGLAMQAVNEARVDTEDGTTIDDRLVMPESAVAQRYTRQLLSGWKWMMGHGFYMRDFHMGNIGTTAEDDAVILDLGGSGSGKSPDVELAENRGKQSIVEDVFDEAFDEIEVQFPDFGEMEFMEDEKAGRDNGAGADRQFAYCKDGDPILIAFAPKAKQLTLAQLRGLMRHEFGHALEFRYGVRELERRLRRKLPKEVERRADVIAEAVWKERILYDARLIQCVGIQGVSPRPNHLPDKKEKLKPNGTGNTAVLPAGSLLFHGTIETFDGVLRSGADGIVWFTDSPSIAQLYIPCSGLSIFVSPSGLTKPSKDDITHAIQQSLGIDYDRSDVDWDKWGRAQSWPMAKGWDHTPRDEDVVRLLRDVGYEVPSSHTSVQIGVARHPDGTMRILGPEECEVGRLIVAQTTRDLRIYVRALHEGDLMNVQYNDIDLSLADRFDGIIINDFAQSEEWGNYGHLSLGLFPHAISALHTREVPAQYREIDGERDSTVDYPAPVTPYLRRLAGV